MEDEIFQAVWRVNVLHPVYLAKVLAKKLMERDQRCAVLITSSMAAYLVKGTYSATKVAVSNFGESIHYELKQNADVLVWEPGYVHSNIHTKAPPGLLTMSTKKAVSDALDKLGKNRKTLGSLLFYFYTYLSFLTPSTANFAR